MAIVKKSIKEQVYEEIRSRIISREYAPGSVLNITKNKENCHTFQRSKENF